jgi:murein DD-endopeptidase MepM/ murein hydrolase activator NlpD
MRRFSPVIIILFAVFLYAGRGTLLDPLRTPNVGEESYPDSLIGLVMAANSGLAAGAGIYEVPDPSPSLPSVVTRGVIRPRSSFFVEMQKAGVSPVDIDRLVRASKSTFNLKKVKPGQEYHVFKSHEGTLDSLSLSISGDKLLKVHRQVDRYHAVIDTLPYHLTYHLTNGIIQYSVFAALKSQGADPNLAGQLALIFGWVVDFFTDIRPGDHFSILYEKKNYEDGRTTLGRVLASRVYTRGREFYAFGHKTSKRSWSYYDQTGKSLQKSLLRAPLSYTRISSNFSYKRKHPVTHHWAAHLGVDYAAPAGTPVKSTGDGTVVAAAYDRANGKYVKIRHNRHYTTYYLHFSRFARGIRNGAKIRQGQVIGYVGSTGMASGPHLDYRIKVDGRFVNPRTINLPSKNPVPQAEMALFGKIRDACLLKFREGLPETGEGKTILVSEPTIHDENLTPSLF